MTMTQHWRGVISQTCETEFLDVESFITSQNGQGFLSAHLKAAINVWENSAVISGSQVVDGVSTQYPTSYLVEDDLYVGADDDMFLLFAEAELSNTPVAPLFWFNKAPIFQQLSDNQALAAVPCSQLAKGGSFELSGDLSVSASSDYVEIHLTEKNGLISTVVVEIELDGSTTRTDLGISPRDNEVQVARPPARKINE
ncbi:hypothetical protein [Corynebacterium stationis]|uniref:hypothetical protein n=1 Tax=Corynebacterium stationis TaxID=1705 RepID=UPI001B80700A|nr:hypothetical protein [Corynebacterium stationis]